MTFNNTAQSIGNLSSVWVDTTGTRTQTITLNGTALTVNQTADGTYGTGAVSTLTSTIGGTGSLIKSGAAKLALTSANTFTGTTTINNGTLDAGGAGALGSNTTGTIGITVNTGGTLLLSGSSSVTDRINNDAALNLNGAVPNAAGTVTFNTGGLSEGAANTVGIGALTLTTSSIIDFGVGASVVEFAGGGIYTAGTLFINNWSGAPVSGNGTDRLLFDDTPNSSLVNNIQFAGFALGQNAILSFNSGSYFEIVPVPEPTAIFSALGLMGLVGWRERRKAEAARRVSRILVA